MNFRGGQQPGYGIAITAGGWKHEYATVAIDKVCFVRIQRTRPIARHFLLFF
ncbi:MAG: hypothetical protein JO353_09015 [Phycisphaerae bacterium]|nr:hypothetical protein [Phycisphaerae bacterium]